MDVGIDEESGWDLLSFGEGGNLFIISNFDDELLKVCEEFTILLYRNLSTKYISLKLVFTFMFKKNIKEKKIFYVSSVYTSNV